ncbi:unnamed protein product, partial [Allacma fusca]
SEGLSNDISKRRLRKRITANSLWAAGVPRQEISESGQSSSSVDLGPQVISGEEQVINYPEKFCSGVASQLPENIFMYSGSQDLPRNQFQGVFAKEIIKLQQEVAYVSRIVTQGSTSIFTDKTELGLSLPLNETEVNFLKGIGGFGSFRLGNIKSHIDIFTSAVRKIPEDSNPSEAAVEKIIQLWLLGSGDRNGGRTQRSKKAQQ